MDFDKIWLHQWIMRKSFITPRENNMITVTEKGRSSRLTIGIADLALIFESNSYDDAKYHKNPIYIRNIYLPEKFL